MTDKEAIEYAHNEGYSIPDFMAGVNYCLEQTAKYKAEPILVIDPSKTNMTKEELIEAWNNHKSQLVVASNPMLWRSWEELPPKDPKFPAKSIRCLVRYVNKDDYEKSKGHAVPYYIEAYYWFGDGKDDMTRGWLTSDGDDEHFFVPNNYELDGYNLVTHWIPLTDIATKGDPIV